MEKTQLVIPCHWDKKVIKEILKQGLNSKITEIKETYGCLAREVVGHGRAPSVVPNVSMDEAVNFKKYIKSIGFKFTYLLNAPFIFDSAKKEKRVGNYLNWIINNFNADALMIASKELMQFIRGIYPTIPIHISTIAGVSNVKQLEMFLDINPARVVVHHDVNRNFKDLQEILKKAKEWGIDIELMATESCLRRCPSRDAHYLHLSGGKADKPFHTVCNTKKLMYPREFLKANVIRPEDMRIYEEMGVSIFKITGRSKPSNWLPEVVEAYLGRKYDGNLIRLLGADPSLKTEEWIYINNKSLKGFLEKFPRSGKENDENTYCDKWISELYKNGDFKLKDGSVYGLNDKGSFRCQSLGERVLSVISREN